MAVWCLRQVGKGAELADYPVITLDNLSNPVVRLRNSADLAAVDALEGAGFEHYEVRADLICCGKGISSGMPLSCWPCQVSERVSYFHISCSRKAAVLS